MQATVESAPAVSRVRRIAFTALTGLVVLALMGATSKLLTGWTSTVDGGIHRFHDIGWGVLEGVVIVLGLLVQFRRPA